MHGASNTDSDSGVVVGVTIGASGHVAAITAQPPVEIRAGLVAMTAAVGGTNIEFIPMMAVWPVLRNRYSLVVDDRPGGLPENQAVLGLLVPYAATKIGPVRGTVALFREPTDDTFAALDLRQLARDIAPFSPSLSAAVGRLGAVR